VRSGAVNQIVRRFASHDISPSDVSALMQDDPSLVELLEGIAEKAGLSFKGMDSRSKLELLADNAQTLFRLSDEWVKVGAMELEMKRLMKYGGQDTAIYDKYLDGKELTEEESGILDSYVNRASDVVRDRYPTFSRAAMWVKAVSRNPFLGGFPTFSYEMVRTETNNVAYATRLIQGKTYDDQDIPAEHRREAALRGSAILTRSAIAWTVALRGLETVAGWIAAAMMGDDGEEWTNEQVSMIDQLAQIGENRRKYGGILPPWMKAGSALVWGTGEGTAKMLDVSYLLPMGGLATIYLSAYSEYQNALEAGKSMEDAAWAFGVEFSVGLVDTFAGDEVLFSAMMEQGAGDVPYDSGRSTLSDEWTRDMVGLQKSTEYTPVKIGAYLLGLGLRVHPFREMEKVMFRTGWGIEDIVEGDQSALEMLAGFAGNATGLKTKHYDYKDDLPRAVKFQKNRLTSTGLADGLYSADIETVDDMIMAIRQYDGERRGAAKSIHEHMNSAIALGAPVQRVVEMLPKTMGGMEPIDFLMGRYAAVSPEQVERLLTRRDKDGELGEYGIAARVSLYRQALSILQYEGYYQIEYRDEE
jgi:hypothetical protein